MTAPANPVVFQILQETVTRLCCARHGEKQEIVQEASRRTGLSVGTVYKRIHTMTLHITGVVSKRGTFTPRRKQRNDAGTTALTRAEAEKIIAYMGETKRANGKWLASLKTAVAALREDGEIVAGRVDPETGEFFPLSISAINQALKHYRLHPSQLSQPAPKIELRSLHPNQCWQIDPSLCVLYYLKREQGLRAMPREEFYKNKPQNFARIEHDRVWRYVIVDHTSGALYVEYVLGAESGENLCNCFINAMQARGKSDPFHGVPQIAMVDPGSANTSAMFQNLCASLRTRVWKNQVGQPWAKGSVEKHNDIVECRFEQGLKFQRIESLAELNAAAWRWMREFNATAIHTRHGMTRYAAWMTITAEQLRTAPSVVLCRRLATSAPVERKVTTLLRVNWRGKEWDVSNVPGVIVGQKLLLARNAWSDADSAHVLGIGEDGRPTHYVVPVVGIGAYGFSDDAVPLGEFRAIAATPADVNRKTVERVAMDAATDDEAAAKRKAKALPFGGRIDPFKAIEQKPEVAYIPRAGTPLDVDVPAVVTRPREDLMKLIRPELEHTMLTCGSAAVRLHSYIQSYGGKWQPAYMARLETRFGDAVPEEDLGAIARWLLAAPADNVRSIGEGTP